MHYAFLLIITVIGVLPCSVKVCLRGTVKSNTLILRCKIDDLHLPVYFDDNHGKEFAFCIAPNPLSKCEPWNKENTTVMQYLNKNETVVIVNGTIDQRVNGNWSCHHGRNLYEADVEINIQTQKDQDKDRGSTCIWLSCCMMMTGFSVVVIVHRLFRRLRTSLHTYISCLQKISKKEHLEERICKGRLPYCSILDKNMIWFTVLLLLFLSVTILIGLVERKPCKASFAPFTLGFILGMDYVVMCLKGKGHATDDHISCTDNPPNGPAEASGHSSHDHISCTDNPPNEPAEASELATNRSPISTTNETYEQSESSGVETYCPSPSSNYQTDDSKEDSVPMLTVYRTSTPDETNDTVNSLGKLLGGDKESTV